AGGKHLARRPATRPAAEPVPRCGRHRRRHHPPRPKRGPLPHRRGRGRQGRRDHRLCNRNGDHMVARSLDTADGCVQGVRRLAWPRTRDADMRYRLDVVTDSVADVVTSAGGWLFDRVMAGWDVTVLIAGDADVRPIQILGAETLDLETALAIWADRPHPHTLAVSVDLVARDSRIRKGVMQALDHGATEVTLWGETWPSEL